MKVIYSNKSVEGVCTDTKKAFKLIKDKKIVLSLFAVINDISNATIIEDITSKKRYRFHGLEGNLKNSFSITIQNRTKWRLIIKLLDENSKEFIPCDIPKIRKLIKIIKIEKVSDHYDDIY